MLNLTSGAKGRHHLTWLLLTLGTVCAGCQRHAAAPAALPNPHYVVGPPWRGDDAVWFYPKEQSDLHQTGLAVIETTHPPGLTADGEVYDPGAWAASHQTLQLPAVLRVDNLENGREITLRVNDRGPMSQGRFLGLTPAAARALGMRAGVPTRVAIDLELVSSQLVADQASGGPHLDIASAPVTGVQEQTLAAPGATQETAPEPQGATRGAEAPWSGYQGKADGPAGSSGDGAVSTALPTTIRQGVPQPGALWINAGQFSLRRYADQTAARVGGEVTSDGIGRQIVYKVRIGPFLQTSDADAALDQALHAGVTGAHIIVE